MHLASSLVILSLLLIPMVKAQVPAQETVMRTERQQQERKALQEKSAALIKEIISEGRMLRLSDNTALVLALSADWLYEYEQEQERSHSMFKEAAGHIGSAMSSAAQDDYALKEILAQSREVILQIVAKRDRKLAEQLMLDTSAAFASTDPYFQLQNEQGRPPSPENDADQAATTATVQESLGGAQEGNGNTGKVIQSNQHDEDPARELVSEARLLIRDASTEEEQLAIIKRLDTARELIGRPKNSAGFGVLLQAAPVYARLNSARSFEIVEGIIDQLNELIAAKVVLSGFSGEEEQILVRQDELTISEFLDFLSNEDICGLTSLLARNDFVRTVNLSSKFQRFEARILSKLIIARSLMADQCATNTP